MRPVPFKLYLIGDRKQTKGRPLADVFREAGKAGVPALQFREKDLPMREQFALASELKQVTKQYGIKLLINSRVDLCLVLDADGVHLPACDIPVSVARRMLGKEKLIARSCHSYEDVKNAEEEGADFAVLGPVFDTPSKRPYGPPLGVDILRSVKEKTHIPLFAIGGITQGRLYEIFETGADGVGMISEILSAEDVAERCRQVLSRISQIHADPSPRPA
ncbi:MAG: thiamine phosphate synthase [Nitrospiria bacterium]